MKIIHYSIIIFTIAVSCRSSIAPDDSIVSRFVFNDPPVVTKTNLSDLGFTDIEYILLETIDSSLFTCTNNLLGSGKIEVLDGYFLINCGNSILLFEENGKFKQKIGAVGRGPNEFTVVHDIKYDQNNNEIFMLVGWPQRFLVYSMSGQLIRSFKSPAYFSQISVVDNGLLCYSENHSGTIEQSYTLIDTDGLVLKSYKNKYPFLNHDGYVILGENIFYYFNNKLYKKEVYSDTIYSFQSDVFKPHIVLSLGDSKLITPSIRARHEGLYLAKNYIIPLRLFEFGNYVYYEFFYKFDFSNSEVYGFIGSRNSSFHAFFDAQTGIVNDIDGGPNIFPRTIKDDRTIIAFVDAMQLKKHISSEEFRNSIPKYAEKKAILEKFARSVKETDNPILILIR